MPLSQIQQAIAHYKAQLAAREAQAERALSYAHEQTLSLIQPALDALYQQIGMAQADGEISASWLYEYRRLQAIEGFITSEIDHFGALAQMQVGQVQHYGVTTGTSAASALLDASVPAGVNWTFGIPSASAITGIVGATQAGSPLADLFSGFGAEAARGAKNALISGITLGYNPRQIAPMVQSALDVSRYRALTIARTEMLRSYREANVQTFQQNSDVVKGWRWTCALSDRTCAACLGEDGTEHDVSDTMDSHVNCRCTPVPITNSWSDILGSVGIDASGMDDSSVLDDMQSGQDWFDEQDPTTQQKVLGKSGYDLYASGQVTLKDFVGRTSDPVWGNSIYQKSVKELVSK